MKDQLITFETAILAKRKGFSCNDKYIWDRVEKKISPFILHWKIDDRGTTEENMYYFYPKCTQSLLQKWLREKHNIHINCYHGIDPKIHGYNYKINDSHNLDNLLDTFTYEEALEHGLQKALKLIK